MTEAQLQELLIGTYKPEEGGFVGGYCQLRGWLVDHTEKVTMKGYGGRTITKTPGAKANQTSPSPAEAASCSSNSNQNEAGSPTARSTG